MKSKTTVMSFACGMLMGVAAICGVAGLSVGTAQAATITWGPATNVVNDSDVTTNGVLQYAEHWGGTDGTVNGAAFTAAGTQVIKSGGSFQTVSWTQGTLSAAYYGILRGNWYNANPGTTVTLNSLVSGHIYRIQIWAVDKRYATSQYQVISGGPSLSIGTGQYAIGTFTADGVTQVITNGTGSAGVLNAVQVRELTVGPVDAGASSVVASPAEVPADNTITATITVTLKDAIGLPVANKVVTLTSSRGATDTISVASGPSSASGVVTFTVKSKTFGAAVFSATDVTDSNLVITQTANVTFNSAIAWGAATTVAGDSDVSTDGALCYAVRFYSATSTDPTLNGVTFTARGTNVTLTASYQDGLGAPSALSAAYRQLLGSDTYSDTTFTLNYLTVGHPYKIQVWANDARGGAANQTVTFTGTNTVSLNKNVSATGYGQYAIGTFTADATNLMVKTVGGAFNAIQVRDISVIAGPVDAATSLVVASPNVVPADGSTAATVTVTLKDASGVSVSNKVVTLTSSRGATDTITPVSGTSSVFGAVTFTATSLTPGTAVFSATDVTDGNRAITQTASVGFSGSVDAGTSTVSVSPASVGADGSSIATVTVTLRDVNTLPVSGKTVTLTSSRGATDTISAASGLSSAAGVVTFTVTSATLGTAVFSATDVTDGNRAITQTANVTFVSLFIGVQQFNAGDVLPSPIIAVSGDLLETSVSSVTGEVAGQKPRNGTTGTAQESTEPNLANLGLVNVTYNLNLTDSPRGYDITEIRLFSGWSDGRAGQSYSISYSLAGTPATFINLGTVSALTTATGSLLTRTYDVTGAKILKGVAALKFTMIDNGYAGRGTVFREFDVLGYATPPKGTMIRVF